MLTCVCVMGASRVCVMCVSQLCKSGEMRKIKQVNRWPLFDGYCFYHCYSCSTARSGQARPGHARQCIV